MYGVQYSNSGPLFLKGPASTKTSADLLCGEEETSPKMGKAGNFRIDR